MTTYATPQDVADESGRPLSSLNADQVSGWLRRAEATIRTRIPDLDARVTSGATPVDLVISVEAAVVARKLANPDGLRATTVSIDDGSMTQTRDSVLSDGVVRLTDDEWLLLLPRRPRGAFSVRPQWSS